MPLVFGRGTTPLPEGNVFFYADARPNTRTYSLNDIFDVLNETLISKHKLVLFRGEEKLMVLSMNELHWPALPRITLAELPGRANTEMVELSVTFLAGVDVEELCRWPSVSVGRVRWQRRSQKRSS